MSINRVIAVQESEALQASLRDEKVAVETIRLRTNEARRRLGLTPRNYDRLAPATHLSAQRQHPSY